VHIDATPSFITVDDINTTPIFAARQTVYNQRLELSGITSLIGVLPPHAGANYVMVVGSKSLTKEAVLSWAAFYSTAIIEAPCIIMIPV
jgi:hypothetical protein